MASRGGALPVLSGIRLEISGNQLRVAGTDLDLTIQMSTGVTGAGDGVAIAPGRLVTDIVRALDPGAVTVESDDDDELRIVAGRSQFTVRTHPAGDFPRLPVVSGDAVRLPATRLAEALRQVVRAASSEDSRPILTGVLMAAEAGGLRLVATDSYRLAMRDIDGSDAFADSSQILVPARALAELQRLSVLGMSAKESSSAGGADGQSGEHEAVPTIGLSIGDHDVTFTAGEVKVSTRLLDGSYPDYRQLIPAEYPNRLHVGKDSLLDALRRVRLLVRDNTTPVRLSMRPGGVDLTVVSQEVGDASETVDADFDGTELTIAFNPTYLIDGVEAVTGDEVLLETVDATKPATVRAAEETSFRYLLMPVRVS